MFALRPAFTRIVALFVFGAFCATALVVRQLPGVYWSRVDARFLAPTSAANPNGLVTRTGSLVVVAGLVGRAVDPANAQPHVGSDSVTLADEGVRHGFAVRLPNSGSQYSTVYSTPVLDVQVVGSSQAEVRTRMVALLTRIAATLDRFQAEAGSPERDRITLDTAPRTPQVFYKRGSPARATLALVVLGTMAAAAVLSGGAALRRRLARPRDGGAPPTETEQHLPLVLTG